MYTGALGSSNVPGSEIPRLACFDSPGPLTTHPMTATCIVSTPGREDLHTGICSRRYVWMSSAMCWKNVDVVRPHPGHAVTWGAKLRRPRDWRICCATSTSSDRSPFGLGVNETRIVSPIPLASRIASAAALATWPFMPIPASVSPRCSG